jgi:hypothetical protein
MHREKERWLRVVQAGHFYARVVVYCFFASHKLFGETASEAFMEDRGQLRKEDIKHVCVSFDIQASTPRCYQISNQSINVLTTALTPPILLLIRRPVHST